MNISSRRRFEILLPRRFPDNNPVPDALFAETIREIRSRFGAISSERQIIQGSWEHQGKTYFDELARIFVDVPDEPEHLQFFLELKERLKARFQQIDIWMTSCLVDVL